MVKNNIEIDVKVKCMEERVTQAQLAEKTGTSAQYLNRVIKNKESVVNKTFVNMMEQLGYNIEINYIKK
ncbi:MAG: helix-turn-helix transcriptional regulator [Lachnospiraceae bacterium]|nr:helix-turn-helix transcriptional regulator [Lachnospiraceae bacterium]